MYVFNSMSKIKKSIIILTAIVFLSEYIEANTNGSNLIIVDISEQRLYLFEKDKLKQSFPVSTSRFGEGSIENSYKTPLGSHEIKEKIGTDVPINTILIARKNTSRKAKIINEKIDSDDDFVTSRILWLEGLEVGKNKGSGVDSYNRYIYIHGTHEEGLIGQKASHGCIRMFNQDVIYLYDKVEEGTKVLIKT